MPQQQGHTVDRHSLVEQFDRECIAEHVSVASFWTSVWPANLCDFKQTRKRTAPAFASGLGAPFPDQKKYRLFSLGRARKISATSGGTGTLTGIPSSPDTKISCRHRSTAHVRASRHLGWTIRTTALPTLKREDDPRGNENRGLRATHHTHRSRQRLAGIRSSDQPVGSEVGVERFTFTAGSRGATHFEYRTQRTPRGER